MMTQPIIVVFRKWKDGSVIALFPTEKVNGDLCLSYELNGEHSSADYRGVVQQTVAATAEESRRVFNVLKNLGYTLKERRRYSDHTPMCST